MISKKKYFEQEAKMEAFEDLPDGAWWAACEEVCGGYDEFMEHLESGRVYEPEKYSDVKEPS